MKVAIEAKKQSTALTSRMRDPDLKTFREKSQQGSMEWLIDLD